MDVRGTANPYDCDPPLEHFSDSQGNHFKAYIGIVLKDNPKEAERLRKAFGKYLRIGR